MPSFPKILAQVTVGGALGYLLALVIGWGLDRTGIDVMLGDTVYLSVQFMLIIVIAAAVVWVMGRKRP